MISHRWGPWTDVFALLSNDHYQGRTFIIVASQKRVMSVQGISLENVTDAAFR